MHRWLESIVCPGMAPQVIGHSNYEIADLLHISIPSSPPSAARLEPPEPMDFMGPKNETPILRTFIAHLPEAVQLVKQIYENDSLITKSNTVQPTFRPGKPMNGSSNILIPFEAENVATYLFKLPFNGTKELWDKSSERTLETEVHTMKRLFKSIPVPFVYAHSATTENTIGCPYMVISYIAGVPLYDVWFGHHLHPDTISLETTEKCRERALDGIAQAMVKLGEFSFAKSGAPVFDDNDDVVDIGKSRFVDKTAMAYATPREGNQESAPSGAGQLIHQAAESRGVARAVMRGVSWLASLSPFGIFSIQRRAGPSAATLDPDVPGDMSDDSGDETEIVVFADWGPTSDPKEYYTRALDLHPQDHVYSRGVESLLNKFISWLLETDVSEDPRGALPKSTPFVFAHPDFDIQNFIVDTDGRLMGIIDWDGVEAVPRSIGNEALPGWLTRDWDPVMYVYESAMGDEEALRRGYQPNTLWEDSEEALARYRAIYTNLIAKHSPQLQAANAARVSRRSLVSENLAIAASDPVCRSRILDKVVSEMWEAYKDGISDTASSGDDFVSETDLYPTFYDIAQLYLENEVDDFLLDRLQAAFKALLLKVESA
ncbi:serine threonine protein kinase [Ophiostoma piceae UAMH 11346]|uniref:Serine threonine protein kinase n=1 Tax=Ophiostoma piceae (strain UAMH 11346) TaxID=1262450 RepID=S3C8Y7_OPHP1|nr:serine threonine protein kinase [Ophiostoma piceae UAMH 11346]